MVERQTVFCPAKPGIRESMSKQINGLYDIPVNTVLGDIEDVHHKPCSEVATVCEDPKLQSFSCNREQAIARSSSSYLVCGILI